MIFWGRLYEIVLLGGVRNSIAGSWVAQVGVCAAAEWMGDGLQSDFQ
jgi:hypothetical protein